MSANNSVADELEALSAEILSADPACKNDLVKVGAALERILEEQLPDEVQDALATVLQAITAAYQETVDDPSAVMDAVASAVASAAQQLSEPEGPRCTKDLHEAIADLRALLPSPKTDSPASESGDQDDTHPTRQDDQGAAQETPGPADDNACPAAGDQDASAAKLPEDTDVDLLKEFVVESLEHISAAEAALLELESNADDADQINVVFRAFHTIKGTSGFLGLEPVQKLAHLAENLLDRVREGQIRILGGYADLALNSCDALKAMIEALEGIEPGGPLYMPENYAELLEHLRDPEAAGYGEEADVEPPRVGDLLVACNVADRSTVDQAAQRQGDKRIGQVLVEQGIAKPQDVAKAIRTQQKIRGRRAAESAVRVGTDRLDRLVDAVGELVIAQSMVAQDPAVADRSNPTLTKNVSHVGKIVRELQDVSMSLRMVPLKATFGKMARLVRDLARKAGKKVRFVTEGEETEIDRNMVEVLNDPLVHMMRNAVDHGIEPPEQRLKAGKDETGTILLRSYHSAGNIVIELRDDGKGLDREKIIAKAIDRGLIKPGQELSDAEAFGLIFQPGFSTAEKVTDVSGRGVGMDVVRNGIESLHGKIDVKSTPGRGSTFVIRLPLTMAITDAMLLRVGRQRYLLPVVSVQRSFRPEPGSVSTVAGRCEMVMTRGSLLPVFRLHELFAVPDAISDPYEGLLIVIESEDRQCAVMADELLGQQQVVVKSLGGFLGEIPGVAGAAILGDGRVGLILDAAGIMQLAARDGVTSFQTAEAA